MRDVTGGARIVSSTHRVLACIDPENTQDDKQYSYSELNDMFEQMQKEENAYGPYYLNRVRCIAHWTKFVADICTDYKVVYVCAPDMKKLDATYQRHRSTRHNSFIGICDPYSQHMIARILPKDRSGFLYWSEDAEFGIMSPGVQKDHYNVDDRQTAYTRSVRGVKTALRKYIRPLQGQIYIADYLRAAIIKTIDSYDEQQELISDTWKTLGETEQEKKIIMQTLLNPGKMLLPDAILDKLSLLREQFAKDKPNMAPKSKVHFVCPGKTNDIALHIPDIRVIYQESAARWMAESDNHFRMHHIRRDNLPGNVAEKWAALKMICEEGSEDVYIPDVGYMRSFTKGAIVYD